METIKHDAWTWAYNPFIMGGNTRRAIIAEVECEEVYDLGKGFKGYIAINPYNNKSYIIEDTSSGIVGNILGDVMRDIEDGDFDVMQKQIEDQRLNSHKAERISANDFWKLFQ